MDSNRVGIGFDVHRLVASRDLIVGGVRIDFERGLAGHSDADVLLHAIMDAMLGGAGLPDIGQQFPPSDEAYRGADSSELLRKVSELVNEAGYRVVNIDAVIMAQRPKMSPYISAMRRKIASVLAISEQRVNVKATTTEKLGFVGREEGIAAQAVVLLAVNG